MRRILLALAICVLAGFALASIAQFGQIFEQWDAVVSWNRWAIDWAANRLPYATSLYPQLLPTNISLSYVFMQSSEVWIFAKGFQFLFCLMLLLAMLDAARVTGNFAYVPGLVITYGLLVALLRFRMLSSGYADVPLAFFSFAAVDCLLLARHAEDAASQRRYLFLGAVLAAGAALTKQPGLYIAAVILIWLRRWCCEFLSSPAAGKGPGVRAYCCLAQVNVTLFPSSFASYSSSERWFPPGTFTSSSTSAPSTIATTRPCWSAIFTRAATCRNGCCTAQK